MSAFRDRHPEFAGQNAQVLGISTDDLDTQKRFAESLEAPFPLLADADASVAKHYGVFSGKVARRVTFVISKQGRILEVFEGAEALDPAGALATSQRANSAGE